MWSPFWVESMFILDRNEGFAFFPGYSSWVSCLFSFFSRVGPGPVLLCSRLRRPSVGWITCRMFFLLHSFLLLSPLGVGHQRDLSSLLLPYLGVNPLASIVTLVCGFPADSDGYLCGCV